MGSMSLVAVALTVWARTGSHSALAWCAATVVVLIGRLLLVRAYHRRGKQGPNYWAKRFAFGAWANALIWGLASFTAIFSQDFATQFFVITVQDGYLSGAATRNNTSPAAVLGQAGLTLVPTFLACLATGNAYYVVFSIFPVLQFVAVCTTIFSFGRQTVRLIAATEEKAALVEEIQRINAQLQDSNLLLEGLTLTDELTGVANRRAFMAAFLSEWRRAQRTAQPLSLLMVDVDHFKAFNDRYGHPAGDQCLCAVAATIRDTLQRPGDVVARYGGEEFAVVLPDTDKAGAIVIGELVRTAIEGIAGPANVAGVAPVTASVGVATMLPDPALTHVMLLEAADRALYTAKSAGRNTVRSAMAAAPPERVESVGLAA